MKYKFYNSKAFIYTIRGIGWISLPLAIHIGLFHGKLLDKYPLLILMLVLIFLLTDYKIDYKKMKFSKRLLMLFGYLIICILCGCTIYFIGCTK
mgnify:FL=1